MEAGKSMDKIDLILQTSKVGKISTSDRGTDSEYMTFYVKNYALYTETEKNSPIMRCIEQSPFVHITLGGDEKSDDHLEIVGEAGVVGDQGIVDCLRREKGLCAVADDMVMLKVVVQKVKLVE